MFKYFKDKFLHIFSDGKLEKKFNKYLEEINKIKNFIDNKKNLDFKNMTIVLKQKVGNQKKLSKDTLATAFALIKKAAEITLSIELYDIQLYAGFVLFHNKIIEMKTGEGKTITATLPTFLNYLLDKTTVVMTVNDYLAKRDALWMTPLFTVLGISISFISNNMTKEEKKKAYQSSIIYGSCNEFVFDYLKNNTATTLNDYTQQKFDSIIIDEIDSILIDEARTPLIISEQIKQKESEYYKINTCVEHYLNKHTISNKYYIIDQKTKDITITDLGYVEIENILVNNHFFKKKNDLYTNTYSYLLNMFLNALKAHLILIKNIDYVVDSKLHIIDENTGRIFPDKKWSGGLQQATEAKERLKILPHNEQITSITFQNYVRLYKNFCGMTGTVKTESIEFKEIYKTDVICIPPHKPCRRLNNNDLIFLTNDEKIKRILIDVTYCYKKNRPTLIGTSSIKTSEYLGNILNKLNIKHEMLNALYPTKESLIISKAGKFKALTVATNMAGRGTDIVLGGSLSDSLLKFNNLFNIKNIEFLLKQTYIEIIQLGGLYVLGTERHRSRRIDNQLSGRCARQGDPGSVRFYLSIDDYLIKVFIQNKNIKLLEKLKIKYCKAITHKYIDELVKFAQQKLEQYNFITRKNLIEFDDIMNKQRLLIYTERKKILQWFTCNSIKNNFIEYNNKEKLFYFKNIKKKQVYDIKNLIFIEKKILLSAFDKNWKKYLENVDIVKKNMYLQNFIGKNPINWYKQMLYKLFLMFFKNIRNNYIKTLCKFYKRI